MAIGYLYCVSCKIELKETVKEYLSCFYCERCYEKKMEDNPVKCSNCGGVITGSDVAYLDRRVYCLDCYSNRVNYGKDVSPWELRVKMIEVE